MRKLYLALGLSLIPLSVSAQTPLPIAQGGTGATTASGARTNLGAAASGANSDITALNNLNSLSLLGSAMSPQTPIGQLGQVSAPYTASLLNTRQDIFRVQVGDCDVTRELQSQPGLPGVTNYTTAGILSCVTTPAGSSSSQATWPDMAVAGVANTYNAGNKGKAAVGLFGLAGVGVDGTLAQGLNLVVSNTPTGTLASDGNGHNVVGLNSLEGDMNVFARPPDVTTTATAASSSATITVASTSGITAAQVVGGTGVPTQTTTVVVGVSGSTVTTNQAVNVASGTTLTFTAPPTGTFQGITSFIAGTTQPASGSIVDAFAAVSPNSPQTGVSVPIWVNAFASHDAQAQTALYVGAATHAIPANSQLISFHMATSSAIAVTNTLFGQSDGSFVFTMQGASTVAQIAFNPVGMVYSNNYPLIGTVIGSTPYTDIKDPSGGDALTAFAGSVYYNENTHLFRTSAASNLMTLSATGLQLYALPSSPPSGAKGGNVCYDTNNVLYKC